MLISLLLACAVGAAVAQCDPGPATGTSVNRCYDDGFVYVDATGNSHGFSWYWGYTNVGQIQGGYLVFHSRTSISGNTMQILTDEYFLAGIIPPPAPYAGTFASAGPLLYAEPTSRTTNTITLPSLLIQKTATNSVVVSWPSPSTDWSLQQNSDLTATNWADVLPQPNDDGINKSVAIWPVVGTKFYRLKYLP